MINLKRVTDGIRRRKDAFTSDFAYLTGKLARALARRRGDHILEFHGVDREGSDRFNWRFISENNLLKFISFIRRTAPIVPLEEMLETKAGGLRFAITFDDGYKGLLNPVRQLSFDGIPVTLFVTPNDHGNKILWTDQVDMAQRLSPVGEVDAGGLKFTKRNHRYVAGNGITLSSFLKQSSFQVIEQVQQSLALDSHVLDEQAPYWKLLDKADIRELAGYPTVAFGSHGITHTSMDVLSATELMHELMLSKQWIEDATGRPVRVLAFPCGRYNADTLRIARQAGYKHFLAEGELNNEIAGNQGVLTRIGIYNRGRFSLLIRDLVNA